MKAIFSKGWIGSLVAVIVVHLIYIFFETTWSPNFRDLDGTLFGRISESALFTELYVPYDTPLFNLMSAFFVITLLPYTVVGAIRDLFVKKRTAGKTS